MRLAAGLLLLLATSAQADCVILLHGLARSAGSMDKLATALYEQGYTTVNVDYPSTDHAIEQLAEMTIEVGIDQCEPTQKIHFVTHSMGGILVRQYLSQNQLPRLGRVVMLGPPNRGSEVVDTLGSVPGFELINGRAGQQLGTLKTSVPNRLGPANFDLGIIAGTRSINLILSSIIPGPDDGKVSLQRARLEGMNDFIAVPVSHPFLMTDPFVIEQVINYLEYGQFLQSEVSDKSQPDK
ncbi:MAG: alpha/beta fold hydrolase [Halieaceae bacterium]